MEKYENESIIGTSSVKEDRDELDREFANHSRHIIGHLWSYGVSGLVGGKNR
jgi:hypothetical protein